MKEIITLEEIKKLYEEMESRPCGDSYFTKCDGTLVSIDTGYAFEGIELFIEELEHRLKELEELENLENKFYIGYDKSNGVDHSALTIIEEDNKGEMVLKRTFYDYDADLLMRIFESKNVMIAKERGE